MPYSEVLADRIQKIVGSGSAVSSRKMFGGLCIMEHGHMLVGVVGDQLMVRVGPDAYEDAMSEPHARPMDFTGRVMKGMVYVDPAGLETDAALASWIERAHAFVSTLPPK